MKVTSPAIIEADLESCIADPSNGSFDPLAHALRQQGYRSVSVGLHTVQIDGALYQLCPVAESVVDSWLRGEHQVRPNSRIRLLRRSLTVNRSGR